MTQVVTSPVVERHLLEAFDPLDRSLNRRVDVFRTDNGYTARFQYEAFQAITSPAPTVQQALAHLAKLLNDKGYTRVRTRLNFRGSRYYAEREPWVDYPPNPGIA